MGAVGKALFARPYAFLGEINHGKLLSLFFQELCPAAIATPDLDYAVSRDIGLYAWENEALPLS